MYNLLSMSNSITNLVKIYHWLVFILSFLLLRDVICSIFTLMMDFRIYWDHDC